MWTIGELEWDLIPNPFGYENTTVNDQRLLPSNWRKDEEGTWRMEIEIILESGIDDESDQETKGIRKHI